MKKVNLTNKELAVLKAIDISEYGDGLTDAVWTWNVTEYSVGVEGITEKSMGGIVNSLVKKDFVAIGGEGEDATIEITTAGARRYIEEVGAENVNKWHDIKVEKKAAKKTTKKATKKTAKKTGPCQQVRDIADKNKKKSRSEVVALCVAAGINKHTAARQYQNWYADNKRSK